MTNTFSSLFAKYILIFQPFKFALDPLKNLKPFFVLFEIKCTTVLVHLHESICNCKTLESKL